ncbi:YraN family protein [Marinomonas sp.]
MCKITNIFPSTSKRKQAKNNGEKAEQFAQQYLTEQGLTFVENNFFCKLGEIDLIFLDHQTYVFVEVRYRTKMAHGSAAESLNANKLAKITKSATFWLQKNNKLANPCRFDAVLFDHKIDRQHLTWLKAVL